MSQRVDYDCICGVSSTGDRSLLARFAAIADTPMLTDVTKVIDQTTFQRNIYAGNALETVQVESHPVVMTVRSSSHIIPEQVENNQATVVSVDVGNGWVSEGMGMRNRFLFRKSIQPFNRKNL